MEGDMESQNQQALAAEALLRGSQQPLLQNAGKPTKTPTQKAIRKTFKKTAHLANLLPTGTVLGFQILSPIFTHQGNCHTTVSQTSTLALLLLCALSCFFLLFTDSFRDERGKVRYGVATFQGLWVIDASTTLPKEEAAKYRLRFIDFFHAFCSLLVFVAVALFDENVVKCFYPTPSDETRELLVVLPVGIGVLCSFLFIVFPSKRHGVGFPLSRQ
ncbi:protein DMP7-like [Cucurbita moschata]|uniref:Protein DMP7-like n=1 Tax=Cucurbita moschata TaxID=3662 RepID=A0A6J1G5E4_CUCMO|nr:protein DMP7-like [Cucurbita moschata]